MRRWLLTLAALAAFAPPARADTTDHYGLLMVWMPGLCKFEPERVECKDLTLKRRDGLNLSFLALQSLRSSSIPNTYCFTFPSDSDMDRGKQWCDMPAPKLRSDVAAQLKTLMPVTQSCQDRGLWAKFASCTLYSPNDYYSRALRLANGVTGSQVNAKIAGAVGKTANLTALVDAFKADFGEDSGTAIDFICRKTGGRVHLLQVRITLQVRALTRGLDKETLWKPTRPLRRSCPENFLVDEPPVPLTAAGQPAPAAPPPPSDPSVPEAVPIPPVEIAPLEPEGPVVH
jgi:ribonuclease I